MSDATSIYLDNAATSFPKPDCVYDAVDTYNRTIGVPIGRAAYGTAVEAERTVANARRLAAELLGAEQPDSIVFTSNGTDSLNLAIHGLLKPGDHVVTTSMEHNSVVRPLRFLEDNRGIKATVVAADPDGRIRPDAIQDAVRPDTRLVAMIHASNVTGAIQPISDVGEIARSAGVLFLVDAAQTVGAVPINVRSHPVDLLACPGHKGLLGPLGTGLLYVRPGLEEQLLSVRQGGTGTRSESDRQPNGLPDKFESGNHNAPGLFGLNAALEWIADRTVLAIAEHEQQMTFRLIDGLRESSGVTVHGNPERGTQTGVVSVSLDGLEPQIAASILDETFGIRTRAGLHCAPLAHQTIGTAEQGGTVRFSAGPFTSCDDIDRAIEAVQALSAAV